VKPSSPDLAGRTILVLEDEFYLAMDLKTSIEDAGGTTLGPFADPEEGLAGVDAAKPDCALVDVNLGYGPSFDVADTLKAAGIPFIFLTGYDASIIPDRFRDVRRVEKPTDRYKVVEVLQALCCSQTPQRPNT
jgi:CheY-like chemotaxis protein